jgi:hypothetical protein
MPPPAPAITVGTPTSAERSNMSRAIHIRSNPTGVWAVYLDDVSRPLSTHGSETAAELAAEAEASRYGGPVLITDRYERVHEDLPAGGR